MGLVDELLGPDCKVAVGTVHELAEINASHPVQIMTLRPASPPGPFPRLHPPGISPSCTISAGADMSR
jgi:hypothetical protein